MKEKSDSLTDSITIDTGVLIEFLENSPLGIAFYQKVLENPEIKNFYLSPIVETELKYIFCRREGFKNAIQIISELLKDFTVLFEEELRNEAAQLKCNYTISIADSYSLAVAKLQKIPIYMKKETEISNNYDELSKSIDIKFIDDLI